MSYFSRVTFEAHSREELKWLHRLRGQPYAQHRALWGFFDRPTGTRQPFLFRELAEDPHSSHRLSFFLVSEDVPSAADRNWHVTSKDFRPKLQAGQQLQFAVRLNPTRSERMHGEPRKRGKRQDLVISRLHELGVPLRQRAAERHRIVHEELPQWLRSRSRGRGFEIESCAVTHYDVLRLRKDEQEVTLSVADFFGCLRVTDPNALDETLRQGLGHGRSFGLGLLLLKPV